MGLCVDENETTHGIAFEVRRYSIVFFLEDGASIEISRRDLRRMRGLLNDPEWRENLKP